MFVGLDESFAVAAEDFGMHFAMGQGEHVVMPETPGAVNLEAGVENRLARGGLKSALKYA